MTEDEEEDQESLEAVQAASNDILHLKQLQESPGWAILRAWVTNQIEARTNEVMLKPDLGNKEIFMKGEVTAFRTFLDVANIIIEDRQYEKEVENA